MGILRNAVAGTLLGAVVAGAGCTSSGRAFTEFAARTATASYLEGQLNPHDRGGGQQQANRQASPTIRRLDLKGGYLTPHNRFEMIIVSTCNYLKDWNNDKFIDFPSEHFGLDNRFSVDEAIAISLSSSRKIPDLKYELLNNKGEKITSVSHDSPFFGNLNIYNMTLSQRREIYPEAVFEEEGRDSLEVGNYLALWYSGTELLGKIEFEVFDNN